MAIAAVSGVLAAPLHDAAKTGDIKRAQQLIAKKADVNEANAYGFTPLLLAQINDHNETAKLLQRHGAQTHLTEMVTILQAYLQALGYDPGAVDGQLGTGAREAIRAFQKREGFAVTGRVSEDWVMRLHGKALSQAQQRLKTLGFNPGSADGEIGPGTTAALRAYQKKSGLPADGRLSAATIAQLLPTATATPNAATPAKTAATLDPKKLSSPDTLRQVQARLQALGFKPGAADGQNGPSTRAAIKAFQKKAGLPVSGELSAALLAALDKNTKTLQETPVNPAQPVVTTAPANNEQLSPRERLSKIQTRLKALGFNPGGVDGFMGPATQAAIRAYQKQVKLAVNGTPSTDLLNRLDADLNALLAKQAEQTAAIEALKSVQIKLRALGFDPGRADGIAGDDTRSAIRGFQKQNRLKADGQLSDTLTRELDAEIVRAVQARLQILGYSVGKADGELGARTQAAIRNFQKKANLPTTGQASAELALDLQNTISAQIAEAEARQRAARQAQQAQALRTAVLRVQTALKAHGYRLSKPDGELGARTQAAIRDFQKKARLPVTGKISEALLARLEQQPPHEPASVQPAASEPLPPIAMVSPQPSLTLQTPAQLPTLQAPESPAEPQSTGTEPLPAPTIGTLPPSAAPAAPTATLAAPAPAPNSSPSASAPASQAPSSTITSIQSRLQALGYYSGRPDGNANAATQAAIRAFQNQVNLNPSGEPSEELNATLKDAVTQQAASRARVALNTSGASTEVFGKLRLQRAANGTLLGCSIKDIQLDLAWCSPFLARRNTDNCKVVLRPNSQVVFVKCS
ncbi:MAG: peptidoglycan-binding protein [Gammaproteobacteria bacterium]